VQTGTYISVEIIADGVPIFAGHFPAAWQLATVKLADENAEMIEYVPF
jgi:hypothetical protein